MDGTGDMRGAITVITMLCFLGIFWWAYRSGNRQRFEDDAQIPFLEDENSAVRPEPALRSTSEVRGVSNDE